MTNFAAIKAVRTINNLLYIRHFGLSDYDSKD